MYLFITQDDLLATSSLWQIKLDLSYLSILTLLSKSDTVCFFPLDGR